MIGMKALQEAIAKIEILEAKVETLEAKVAALEGSWYDKKSLKL